MATLRTSEVFNNSTYRVVVVESVECRQSKAKTVHQLFGFITPIAIVVYSPEGVTAFDTEARPADYDRLKRDVPALDSFDSRPG